ncbi:MAG: TRAP transporter substrate-binding protein DctP [Gammaproteobacteria bacterium]|nr:TRAP transporter substrate-binding protein DctP [Gammaproteobacteria bacterium]
MKNLHIKTIAMSGVILSAIALYAPPMAAQTTLRITLQLPLKNHLGQNLLEFKEQVESRSGGDIAVEIYDSAQLYKDKEVPQAVGSGAIEMGVASLTRFVGDVPAVDIFYQPFLFNSDELIGKATARGSSVRAPLDEAILQKTGARVLWWQAYGSAVFLSRGDDVRSPHRIADKKVRVFGKTLGSFVQACGAAPTLISGSEQYLAYQRGIVDIGMTGVSGVKSRKLWEVMDTITKTQHGDIEFVVVINDAFWNKLPDSTRAIITAAAEAAERSVRGRMGAIERDAYAAAAQNGMRIVTPSADDIDRWKACAAPVYEQYVEDAGELGRRVLQAARAL